VKILVTAGSTEIPIDQVRLFGNPFKGKTGTYIAKYFASRGHAVTLLTSSPRLARGFKTLGARVVLFRTFDELHTLLRNEVRSGGYDVIIQSAAVGDFKVVGVYKVKNRKLVPIDRSKKISSKHQRLFFETLSTIKLIDQIRKPWGFKGILVKFKLEVGITDKQLIVIGQKSRKASHANLIVANCWEWHHERAYIIDAHGRAQNVKRNDLPGELYQRIKRIVSGVARCVR
jgi:phosphopantothenoylcysteine synthetase/decarboxylase